MQNELIAIHFSDLVRAAWGINPERTADPEKAPEFVLNAIQRQVVNTLDEIDDHHFVEEHPISKGA